jgi:D-ornithine---citrate ligase
MAQITTRKDSRTTRVLQTNAEHEVLGAAAVYAHIHSTDPQPEETFIDELPAARQSICHRLVGGLLRGQPDGLPPYTIVSTTDPSLPATAHSDLRAIGETKLFRRLQPLPERSRYISFLPFPASDCILAAPLTAIHGYDRFHLVGSVHLLTSTETVQDPHPADIVPLLKREGAFSDTEQADRIADELAESVANLALARLAYRITRSTLSNIPSKNRSILDIQTELPGVDPASALERLAIEGHPFHPSAKIRRGMAPAELLRYAPEFTDTIDVRFVAVDRASTLQVQTGATLTDRLYDQFPGLEAAVEYAIPTRRSREEYALIPIHPWQYYHVIPDRYARQIRQDSVVPLSEYTWPATPLLNLRTVVPAPVNSESDDLLPHLKLAVNVQLTNAIRTVSPQAVSNGPRVTELVDTILERESYETLGILSESAAACYHAPDGPHPTGEEFDNARNLSGLLRMNPYEHQLVSDEDTLLSVGSLLAMSPTTDRPIFCDVLDRFIADQTTTNNVAATRSFFQAYVDAVVPEQLRLLSKYGVALETHPQNTYVVFDDGAPAATLAQDLGGIRLLGERLSYHNLAFNAYPDSDLDAHSPRDLYNKLYYALFQNHFGELIIALTKHTALDEPFCWKYIRACCQETFENLRSESEIPTEWIDRDENALFENPVTHKALTAMRLQGKQHEYVTSQVSNPLADPLSRGARTSLTHSKQRRGP